MARSLHWIDPSVVPGSKVGWNVVCNITVDGQFATTTVFALRQGLATLGYDTSPTYCAYRGQEALPGYRFTASIVLNFPYACSKAAALAYVAKVTPGTMAAASARPVRSITFAPSSLLQP